MLRGLNAARQSAFRGTLRVDLQFEGVIRKLVAAVLLTALLATAWALRSGKLVIPPPWNPWTPLDIREKPNALTRLKLWRLQGDQNLCTAALQTSALEYAPLPDRQTGPGCGLRNAVLISDSPTDLSAAFSLSCPAAIAFALWERHVLHVAASTYLEQGIQRIDHFGSYACRNVYGRTSARRSQHATADAIDIAGFVLADGTSIRIVNAWGADDAHSQFLRAVRDGACQYFDAVLGPDYNAAHRDHFHFDRGPYRTCR